jgi:hypothetical protein
MLVSRPFVSLAASSLALGSLVALALACGGGTPHAKDEGDTTASAASSGDDSSPASSAAPSDSSTPAAAASSAPASTGTPPATTTSDASGELKANTADDPWLASHQMPPGDVMRTMKAAGAKVQACWKAGLKRDPSTSGEVKIRLVITNDGKVRAWRDDGSSMSDEEVTQCVGGVVEKLKFPKQKSPGDAWGAYSIHFGA